jgi:hypothetical protein
VGRVKDIIGADLVARYPEHYARVALNELGKTMPVCPLCGTGDCTHTPTEAEMSDESQRTENEARTKAVTTDSPTTPATDGIDELDTRIKLPTETPEAPVPPTRPAVKENTEDQP